MARSAGELRALQDLLQPVRSLANNREQERLHFRETHHRQACDLIGFEELNRSDRAPDLTNISWIHPVATWALRAILSG